MFNYRLAIVNNIVQFFIIILSYITNIERMVKFMLPVITISRQFGSGGKRIAVAMSEKLGIKYYDKELIAMAAKESGLSEEVFSKADEKASNSLLYSMVMGNYPFGRMPTNSDMPINDKLFMLQSEIIKEAAAQEPCIIVGRCGDYILREHPRVMKVFIHSVKEDRMAWAVSEKLCDERKASDFITKMDKQRSNYHNFYSNKRWEDMVNYDLTINSSTYSIETASDIIIAAAKLF